MTSPRDELRRHVGALVNQQLSGPMDKVRRKVAAWQDPRAKLLRRRRRASRSLAFRSTLAALTGGVAFFIGGNPAVLEWSEIGFGSVAVLSAAGAVSAGVKSIRLHRTPLPAAAAPPPPPLPPSGSMAREPMQRLATAESNLDELLRQLSAPHNGLAPLSLETVEYSRATAAEAASAVRAVAQQLRAVELARDSAPALERGHLADEVRRLRNELDEGVDGYCGLVATAGRAVAASSTAAPRQALEDATDHLAGLAAALRELAGGRS
ncbi:phage shock envelope stress response protein PspM [Crossiella sp. NPDC003009]